MISLEEIIRQYPSENRNKEFFELMVKEYLHHQILKLLFSGKYADKISFMGGTALRYFYNIKRFSEDLDFDCHNMTTEEFADMTEKVEKGLKLLNIDVKIEDKERFLNLKAFRRVFVFPELKYRMGLSQHKESKFFIKIETQSQNYEYNPHIKNLVGFEIVIPVRIVPLEILFASKILALLSRKKDRDFYDFIFLSTFAKPDFNYLNQKAGINSVDKLKDELTHAALSKNLSNRTRFDCEHMLLNKEDKYKISDFEAYVNSFNFDKFL